jgi:hypothetical protein
MLREAEQPPSVEFSPDEESAGAHVDDALGPARQSTGETHS